MTRQEYKSKMTNRIIFRSKITNKEIIDALHSTNNLDEIIMFYITTLPKPETLNECHNQFAWLRKYSLPLIQRKSKVSTELYKTKQNYNQFIKATGITNTTDFTPKQFDHYQLYLDVIKDNELLIKALEDMILKYCGRLEDICEIYDRENLDFNDFCSMINMNPIIAKQNIREEESEHKHYHYLFGGIESDRSCPDWKQNKSNDMPLFNLIHKNLIIFMNRNKELKQKMDNFMMHDMGMAQHMMTMKEDADGNKTLEKYYPPLKAIK